MHASTYGLGAWQRRTGSSIPVLDGVAPTILGISPDPSVGLANPFDIVTVTFSEPIVPAFLDATSLYLVDGAGTLIPFASATPQGDGSIIDFVASTSVGSCDSFSINVTNGLMDASGELLTYFPAPTITGSPSRTLFVIKK